MIQDKNGINTDTFVSYIEQAVSKLADEQYSAFVHMFDSSRLSDQDVVLALKFLDMEVPVTKIDNPLTVKSMESRYDIGELNDGSGYYMDYNLSTGGDLNDLTLSCEFLKTEGGYRVCLSDLHTM